MTWRPEVPADFAGEAAKIRYRAMPYANGCGLDVACGPWKVFANAIGIDGNAYVTADNRGPSLAMDCRTLPFFATGVFDYVFSSHFLEHVEHPQAVLREWWRVVKEDGYLILYLPHRDLYPRRGQPGANPDHKHDFAPEDIVRAMRGVGGGWMLLENEVRGEDDEYSFFQVYRKRSDQNQIDASERRRPEKTAAIVRPGNFGDAIWAVSIARQLKLEGYHVTAYVEAFGEEVLRHEPDIDRVICMNRAAVPETEWGKMWESETKRYDRWINLTQTVEVQLLSVPGSLNYHFPDATRRSICNRNYVEFMHEVAGVPYELGQRVSMTFPERQWARSEREKLRGRVLVLCNGGSTAPKWWPYAPAFAGLLAELGVHVMVMGDLKGLEYPTGPFVHVSTGWTIRQSIAFAQEADAVVGQETGVLNAVALENVAKVVMLTHSTAENLTRDWHRTIALHGDVACYPCHRIHYTHQHCPQDETTKAAKCQAAIRIETVMEALRTLGVVTDSDIAALSAPSAPAVAQTVKIIPAPTRATA
jgi:ADP-heptose:LPS heptosyltransferase/predicted SAM-dependent methyltransferase